MGKAGFMHSSFLNYTCHRLRNAESDVDPSLEAECCRHSSPTYESVPYVCLDPTFLRGISQLLR